MFKWQDEYSVHIPLVDEQHKKLFEIAGTLENLLNRDDDILDDIVDCISKLMEYTKYHFLQEEQLMKTYEYLELDEHIKEHESFMTYLMEINFTEIAENQKASLRDLIKFISSWIFKHIMNVDFKYSAYIVDKLK
ncbi:bacteriohemerythrin [Acidaminobacter sp. JC074]|uniref:bacteriohemerythrin n=1 Tax=Acidaminobacter sp. JC074 TaxID=2530199 RepID=UPI001F0D649E|nr:hemerythrin family protein [Acidaminobacter sp. JC074]MCH4889837.1 bacteriohemerythrin [Acidaminobacter sp. JC074]